MSEPPLGFDIDLDLLLARDRRRADPSQRRLNVLTLNRGDDVVRSQIELGQPVRIEPDARRIVERSEQRRLPDAFDPCQRVDEVDRRIVAQVNGIVGIVRGVEAYHLQQGGGFLADGQAGARHFLRQLRDGEARAVLHIDGIDVRIGAQCEGDGQVVAAVGTAGRLIVERIVDAVDLLLDRLRHRRLDDFGIGTGISRGEGYLWRHDVGELRDRNRGNGDDARKRDDNGNNESKPRPLDEDAGKHSSQVPGTTVAATT